MGRFFWRVAQTAHGVASMNTLPAAPSKSSDFAKIDAIGSCVERACRSAFAANRHTWRQTETCAAIAVFVGEAGTCDVDFIADYVDVPGNPVVVNSSSTPHPGIFVLQGEKISKCVTSPVA
jgi:hypothetical protein